MRWIAAGFGLILVISVVSVVGYMQKVQARGNGPVTPAKAHPMPR